MVQQTCALLDLSVLFSYYTYDVFVDGLECLEDFQFFLVITKLNIAYKVEKIEVPKIVFQFFLVITGLWLR